MVPDTRKKGSHCPRNQFKAMLRYKTAGGATCSQISYLIRSFELRLMFSPAVVFKHLTLVVRQGVWGLIIRSLSVFIRGSWSLMLTICLCDTGRYHPAWKHAPHPKAPEASSEGVILIAMTHTGSAIQRKVFAMDRGTRSPLSSVDTVGGDDTQGSWPCPLRLPSQFLLLPILYDFSKP